MESKDTKQKKVSRRTILGSLYDREINGMKTPINCVRATYQNLHPNCSIINVEKPPCYLRKFTPDGRYLIAISEDLTSIEVYDYLGCVMATDLLKKYKRNCIGQNSNSNVCSQIFKRLFQLRNRIKILTEEEQLNRECCLFTENGYAVVASTATVSDDRRSQFYQMYSNNEAICSNPLFPIEDYTIYLVNLTCGTISHYIHFKMDKICLTHNQGVYLLKNTLVILSNQHQLIHVYKIIKNRLCLQKIVGRFCLDDDHLLITSVYTTMNHSTYKPFRENIINGLKQKLLIFLYKKADREVQKTGSQNPIKKFYHNFNEFLSLRMWKMQLLGDNYVLIRYSSEKVVTLKIQEPNTQAGLFMIYDIDNSKVIDVFDNTSSKLVGIFERYIDNFRYPHTILEGLMPSSIANNIHTKESYEDIKKKTIDAKLSVKEINKCILSRLPIAAQSFMSSPYLDKSLFSYDEEWVSTFYRPMQVADHPIKFYSRDSGLRSFCFYTKKSNIPACDALRIISFIFHPTDPFVISVQKENSEFNVNFHIRKVYMPE